jgi:hypothetical protein
MPSQPAPQSSQRTWLLVVGAAAAAALLARLGGLRPYVAGAPVTLTRRAAPLPARVAGGSH